MPAWMFKSLRRMILSEFRIAWSIWSGWLQKLANPCSSRKNLASFPCKTYIPKKKNTHTVRPLSRIKRSKNIHPQPNHMEYSNNTESSRIREKTAYTFYWSQQMSTNRSESIVALLPGIDFCQICPRIPNQ